MGTIQQAEREGNDRHGLVEDCRVMLRYARKNALPLTEELIGKVARVDRALKARGIRAVSDITGSLVGGETQDARAAASAVVPELPIAAGEAGEAAGEAGTAAPQRSAGEGPPATPRRIAGDTIADDDDVEILLMNVHADLSRVIAPATALTLIISEPPPGPHRIFGGMPLLVKAAAGYAIFSAILFVIGTSAIAQKKVAEAERDETAAKTKLIAAGASAARPGVPAPAASTAAQPEPKARR